MNIYKRFVRPVAFRQDAESVHNKAVKLGSFLGRHWITRKLVSLLYSYENRKLETEVLGIKFRNPIGLAAGFDKNGLLTGILPSLGFGFMEIGSITGERCEGNPRPRLWRLPKDRAIAVNYGLCNDGAEAVARRLQERKHRIPLAVSVAKTNDAGIKGRASVEDYNKGFELVKGIADFVVINISCPNTGDGCSFENPGLLSNLLRRINNKGRIVFLKLSIDVDKKQVDEIIALARKHNICGFIIGNLSKKREGLKSSKEEVEKTRGGLSGDPAREKSNGLIKYVYRKTKGEFIIIGVGGVFTARDAYEKIKSGASLVQVLTGMIYEGPGVVKRINKGLVRLLKRDGYRNIAEAVGRGIG